MKHPCKIAAIAASLIAVTLLAADEKAHNALTPQEKEQGWVLLFDGQTTTGWRGFQKEKLPEQGWAAEDGCLKCLGKKGGDIVSTEKYTDFELSWEWKLSPKGNSGVKYFVDEKRADAKGKVYGSAIAHEYQMLDDDGYGKSIHDNQKIGSWYDVIAPQDANAKPKPLGEFNQSRLIIKGKHVEHWLNGVRIVTYEIDSKEAADGIAASKFKNVPGYGDKIATPILLQDHNTPVWFRDIKLRPLPAQ